MSRKTEEIKNTDLEELVRQNGEPEETEAEETEETAEAEDMEAEEAEEAEETEAAEPEEEPEEEPAPEEEPEEDAGEDAEEAEEAEEEPAFEEPLAEERPEPVKKRPRKHKKKHRVLRFLVFCAIIAAFVGVANLPYFGIQEIAIIGNKTVSDKKILKNSRIETGDSVFLLNPWLTEHRIKKNLYISDVKIHRHLPGTVEITVEEREAVAQFIRYLKNNRKNYVVTDETGMVISRGAEPKEVTMIEDMTVLKAERGDKIKVKETGPYKKAMQLIKAAEQGDLYFKRIKITGSLVDAYIFDGLVCKGRFDNLMHSIESGELKAVVYQLYQNDVSKGTINIGDNNYCSFTP